MGKFVITKRSNGEFQFNLKADNGETILTSEGYSAKASCLNGIESVRTNSQLDANYEKKTSSNGKHFFNLKASNGQTIGTSELYETASGRDGGIESVKRNAPDANIVDESSKAA
ncbi:YegP family protein [Chitinophaga sp.]|uniref:YegP family protein n=1 Tax=Chitinophaga sp. TaxID=1869181 RepID=UPI0031D29D93